MAVVFSEKFREVQTVWSKIFNGLETFKILNAVVESSIAKKANLPRTTKPTVPTALGPSPKFCDPNSSKNVGLATSASMI